VHKAFRDVSAKSVARRFSLVSMMLRLPAPYPGNLCPKPADGRVGYTTTVRRFSLSHQRREHFWGKPGWALSKLVGDSPGDTHDGLGKVSTGSGRVFLPAARATIYNPASKAHSGQSLRSTKEIERPSASSPTSGPVLVRRRIFGG